MFWCLSVILNDVYFSPAALEEPVCRRISIDVCGNFGSPPSGTEGWGFCFGVFQLFYTMYISPRPRGGNWFSGGSLETFAAILVRLQAEREGGDFVLASFQQFYTMYIYSRLRGGNRFAGRSLETFAVILVRLQAEREGGDFVMAPFNRFTPCIFLPGCAGGTGLPAGL